MRGSDGTEGGARLVERRDWSLEVEAVEELKVVIRDARDRSSDWR